MQIDCLTTNEQMKSLAGEWDSLTREVPFRSFAWLHSWWESYQEGSLFLLTARDEQGRLSGLAPWYRTQGAARGSVLQLLGSGEVCSDYLSVLSTPETAEAATGAMSAWLKNHPQEWDTLDLSGVSTSDCATAKLIGNLADEGHAIHRKEGPQCWRIELSGDWNDYLATMSKSHRKQIRRAQRKWIESGEATIHQATDEAGFQKGMEILVDLHQKRRESLGEPGCFASTQFTTFLHRAAERMFADKTVELHWVEIQGRPAAIDIHLAGGGVSYAYQSGLDPELIDQEPGRLIMTATLQNAIRIGRRAYDLLRGNEPYKAHWRAEPRPNADLRIAAASASSQLRHGVWLAGDAVKNLVKTGLSLTGMH